MDNVCQVPARGVDGVMERCELLFDLGTTAIVPGYGSAPVGFEVHVGDFIADPEGVASHSYTVLGT